MGIICMKSITSYTRGVLYNILNLIIYKDYTQITTYWDFTTLIIILQSKSVDKALTQKYNKYEMYN